MQAHAQVRAGEQGGVVGVGEPGGLDGGVLQAVLRRQRGYAAQVVRFLGPFARDDGEDLGQGARSGVFGGEARVLQEGVEQDGEVLVLGPGRAAHDEAGPAGEDVVGVRCRLGDAVEGCGADGGVVDGPEGVGGAVAEDEGAGPGAADGAAEEGRHGGGDGEVEVGEAGEGEFVELREADEGVGGAFGEAEGEDGVA